MSIELDPNRLIERQTAHIQAQRAEINELRAQLDSTQSSIIQAQRAEITNLRRELVDAQGSCDYAEDRAAAAVQTALKQQAIMDQALAHIEALENRIAELTEMVDESDYALIVAAEALHGSTEPYLREN